MTQRTLVIPVIGCLFVAALAGCDTGKTATEAPPQVATAPAPQEPEAPVGDRRDAVIWGGVNGVGDRVFFAYDSSLLSADAMRTLQAQATYIEAYPAKYLTIEGHADERGTREYNLALGDRRANAVRDYLIAQGVAADRVRTISYGKERPQVAGHDEAAWSQNRRGVSVLQ